MPREKSPLSARDIDVLETLAFANASRKHYNQDSWMAPLDIGGSNGSHHSYTLKKLSERGLCDRKKYGGKREKGSCRYRSNEAGIAWLTANTSYAQRQRVIDLKRNPESES